MIIVKFYYYFLRAGSCPTRDNVNTTINLPCTVQVQRGSPTIKYLCWQCVVTSTQAMPLSLQYFIRVRWPLVSMFGCFTGEEKLTEEILPLTKKILPQKYAYLNQLSFLWYPGVCTWLVIIKNYKPIELLDVN